MSQSPHAFIARGKTLPIQVLPAAGFKAWLDQQPVTEARWIRQEGFHAAPGTFCKVPGRDGELKRVLVGHKPGQPLAQLAGVARKLPKANYHLEGEFSHTEAVLAHLGWALACYRFNRYTKQPAIAAQLLLPAELRDEVRHLADAQALVRDLVNTPTEDLGPEQLAAEVRQLAEEFGGAYSEVVGDELLAQNFPAIHAVGRACSRAPRLARLTWGDDAHPKLSLVGKGVCFDTGGLDIKPSSGMLRMKKDMGGAAHAIALARLVMAHQLPVSLELLIPAVENSIDGSAYRPGDIIPTRRGLSVEVNNTDAEGRIILSDALTLACEREPELVIDYATLTGAARIALGADLPAMFCNDDELAAGVMTAGERVADPMWRMPLYQPYKAQLKSPIADLSNVGKSSYGGAVTAALFLEHFIARGVPWMHLDTYAWADSSSPGRPEGGEAYGLRAVFEYLRERFPAKA